LCYRAFEMLSSRPKAAENNRHERTGKTACILRWARSYVFVVHTLLISKGQLGASTGGDYSIRLPPPFAFLLPGFVAMLVGAAFVLFSF
jgi:hypothetical protein